MDLNIISEEEKIMSKTLNRWDYVFVINKEYVGDNRGLMTVSEISRELDFKGIVKNNKGENHIFETEREAIEKLNEWYKPHQIDDKFLQDTNIDLDLIRD